MKSPRKLHPAVAAMLPAFAAEEARASVALDAGGTTTVVTNWRPRRDRPGFGCPHCAEPLKLDSRDIFRSLLMGGALPCCGYTASPLELVRWLRAARLLASGAAAH